MRNFLLKNSASLWEKPAVRVLLFLLVGFYIYSLSKSELSGSLLFSILPLAFLFICYLFINPLVAFFLLFGYNYFAMGVCRYFPAQWGLGIEGFIVLIYLGLFFRSFKVNLGFSKSLNDLLLVAVIWFLYAIFELFNPEADSRVAWFFGMRQVSLYFVLLVPLVFVLFTKRKYVDLLLKIWAVFSILAVIKGWGQLYIGLDWGEQLWMNSGGYRTHLIWSGLRVFSFFTDAGQFGSSMGHSGVVFCIVALGRKNRKEQIFFMIASLLSFYGMALSGTRGAMAVPAAGFVLFLILVKNWRLIILGAIVGFSFFAFLKYTTIGSGNGQIVRMRTALNPNDESLQLRLNNQARFREYLKDKPFGCGMGSTGNIGHTFFPNNLSSQIPTDSWFVGIWVELGIVGLLLHIFILFYCLARGGWIVMTKIRDKELYFTTTAFLCGYFGIIATSYGNEVLGQMPTCLITYITLTLVFMSVQFQEEIDIKDSRLGS